MDELEVDAQDVVRLMLQFCKENGLKESLRVLQSESQVFASPAQTPTSTPPPLACSAALLHP